MGDRATKKYEVNPGLKAILAEGKTSTFSLTNLFDTEDFKRDEEENDQFEDGQNDGQQFEDAPRSRDEREMMDESRPDEEAPEDGALEEDRSNRQRQEDRNQFRSEPVREYFFFSKNDERFERLKFYDSSKIERHNQDWNRKKEQLVMVGSLCAERFVTFSNFLILSESKKFRSFSI